MADRDEGALERAEGLFKKVLERIGSSVDEKLAGGGRLKSNVVGRLAAAVEDEIESHLRADGRGVRRLAPDRVAVMLTYEQNAELADSDRKALAAELAATAYEYIENRRYATNARVYVEVGTDIFATHPRIEVSFSPGPGDTADGNARDLRTSAGGAVKRPASADSAWRLVGAGGKPVVRVTLAPGGDPVTIGRASGNRLHIDHDSVSKFHATITMSGDGRLRVSDLGSTNGTFVNGEKTPISGSRIIVPDDTVAFGDVPFRIEKL